MAPGICVGRSRTPAPCGRDQAEAAASPDRRRVHHRRFHRRRGSGHGRLPGRAHPADHRKTRAATFGALCRDCPLREPCTKSKTGRKIVLHPRDDLLRQARRDWADKPHLRQNYRKFRPNVERVISQIASHRGRRLKLRYRGTTKNNAWLTRRTAALNLRNLAGRGLSFPSNRGGFFNDGWSC